MCSWLCRQPAAQFAAKLVTFSSWVKYILVPKRCWIGRIRIDVCTKKQQRVFQDCSVTDVKFHETQCFQSLMSFRSESCIISSYAFYVSNKTLLWSHFVFHSLLLISCTSATFRGFHTETYHSHYSVLILIAENPSIRVRLRLENKITLFKTTPRSIWAPPGAHRRPLAGFELLPGRFSAPSRR